jgi:hypothetical protein
MSFSRSTEKLRNWKQPLEAVNARLKAQDATIQKINERIELNRPHAEMASND